MDLQTATLNTMWWQVVVAWAQAGILVITAGIVLWYTLETKRLRVTAQRQVEESQKQVREAQRQLELQLRPFVILKATHENLHIENIGNGPAINARVQDFALTENQIVSVLPEPIPVLLSKDVLTLRDEISVGEQLIQGQMASGWLEVLRPPKKNLTRAVTRTLNERRPEIVVEFENLEGQRYFVRESLKHGILEILGSGKL
jgi:hypothetical protein